MDPHQIAEFGSIIIFLISYYGLITTRNIIKSIVFIVLMEMSVVMFWLSFGFRVGIVPPIMASMYGRELDYIADPFPQALMITAIVIGLSITAINTVMFITLYRKHRTTNWDTVRARSSAESSS